MQPDLFPEVFPLPEVIFHEGTLHDVSAMLDAAEAQEAALAAAVLKPGDPVFVWVEGWPIPATVVELQGTRVVVDQSTGHRSDYHCRDVTPRVWQ